MLKQDKTNSAVDIMHQRYIGNDKERKASLEGERLNADVAKKINDLRKDAGLTQKELAKLVGTTQSVISRLEDADYEGHSLSMLWRIAKGLNKRLTVVITEIDQEIEIIRHENNSRRGESALNRTVL